EPIIAFVVRGGVVHGEEIVLKAAGDHVEINPPMVKLPECGGDLRHCVWMHIDRLDGDKRAECLRVLDNHMREQPWIEKRIIGVNENAPAAGLLAPTSDIENPLPIEIRCDPA